MSATCFRFGLVILSIACLVLAALSFTVGYESVSLFRSLEPIPAVANWIAVVLVGLAFSGTVLAWKMYSKVLIQQWLAAVGLAFLVAIVWAWWPTFQLLSRDTEYVRRWGGSFAMVLEATGIGCVFALLVSTGKVFEGRFRRAGDFR